MYMYVYNTYINPTFVSTQYSVVLRNNFREEPLYLYFDDVSFLQRFP